MIKKLTRAEEEIMQILWQLEEAKVAEIIEKMPKPKPAYNTVSTIVRILQDKQIVDYRKQGRGHIYFPKISKETYSKFKLKALKDNYFEGSIKNMVSFFVKKKEMSIEDLEEILTEINKK